MSSWRFPYVSEMENGNGKCVYGEDALHGGDEEAKANGETKDEG